MISIITPVKNVDRWIDDCYRSIQQQSYSNWEWIVVNDHSSDNTATIINQFASSDHRVRPIENDDKGIISALQKALVNAKGEYITRMDADDLMPPKRLEQMFGAIQDAPANTLITGLVKYFDQEIVSEGYQVYEEWLNEINLRGNQWSQVYRECVIASPNWLMRKMELDSIGGFSGLSYPEDYDLVFQLYKHNFQIEVIPEITLYWREHPDRTSRNSPNYQQEAFFELKVRRFIAIDYHGGPLIVWGNNVKSRLSMDLLKQHGLVPIQQDLQNYRLIEKIDSPQLLIAVYPESTEKGHDHLVLEEYRHD